MTKLAVLALCALALLVQTVYSQSLPYNQIIGGCGGGISNPIGSSGCGCGSNLVQSVVPNLGYSQNVGNAISNVGNGVSNIISSNNGGFGGNNGGFGGNNGGFGGNGYGQLGIVGELPIVGSTYVDGNLPIIGVVEFNGALPAGGYVSVVGNTPCECGNYNYNVCY